MKRRPNGTLTRVEMFRLKFKSQTYTYNFFRGAWERRFGGLDAYGVLVSQFPHWRSYDTGHVKPSVEAA